MKFYILPRWQSPSHCTGKEDEDYAVIFRLVTVDLIEPIS